MIIRSPIRFSLALEVEMEVEVEMEDRMGATATEHLHVTTPPTATPTISTHPCSHQLLNSPRSHKKRLIVVKGY